MYMKQDFDVWERAKGRTHMYMKQEFDVWERAKGRTHMYMKQDLMFGRGLTKGRICT